MSAFKVDMAKWISDENGHIIQPIDEFRSHYIAMVYLDKRELDTLIRAANCHAELVTALKALLPEGWGDDDTMDHIPGVKLARAAIARAEGK